MDSERPVRHPRRLLRRAVAGTTILAACALVPGTRFASAQTASQDFTMYPDSFLVPNTERPVTTAALPPPSACESGAVFGPGVKIACYGPSQIRKAYDVPSTLTGAGQTIVIVDAYGSPTIQADLHSFDLAFGLPDPALNIFYPGGKIAFNNTNVNEIGWAVETSLDVEYAHSLAPGAAIDLVVATSPSYSALLLAESFAVARHLGNVMSLSYGSAESNIPYGRGNFFVSHGVANYTAAAGTHMTVLVASGDGGANENRSTAGTAVVGAFPANNPNVTAVGGTNLITSDDSGTYAGETVWNDSDPATCCPFGSPPGLSSGATGGAPSVFYPAPGWQQGITGMTSRTATDISWNASDRTGVWVVARISPLLDPFYPNAIYGAVGGTSEGAPSLAGVVALADQAAGRGLGNINPWLYTHMTYTGPKPIFHDITVGQNGAVEHSAPILGPGYPAKAGWDEPTGVGTPDVRNFINAIAGTNY